MISFRLSEQFESSPAVSSQLFPFRLLIIDLAISATINHCRHVTKIPPNSIQTWYRRKSPNESLNRIKMWNSIIAPSTTSSRDCNRRETSLSRIFNWQKSESTHLNCIHYADGDKLTRLFGKKAQLKEWAGLAVCKFPGLRRNIESIFDFRSPVFRQGAEN